jgi:hypothetical protein
MSDVLTTQAELASCLPLANLLLTIPPGRRAAVFQSVVSFRPSPSLENSFAVGPLRAAFAEYCERRFGDPVPVQSLRAALHPPVPIGTVLEFNKLALARDLAELEQFLSQLVRELLVQRHEEPTKSVTGEFPSAFVILDCVLHFSAELTPVEFRRALSYIHSHTLNSS